MGIGGGWLRAKRGAWIGAAGAFAAAVIVAVYAAVVPTGQTLPAGSKATPFALTVFSSPSLPPQVQAEEAATAPLLFDRDTTTQHVAFDVSSVQAAFESPRSVSAIKIFGPAPYLLSVKADAGGSFQSIAGLENLNLTALPAAWNTFTAAVPVTTGKILLTLTPQSGGSNASGLSELEIWTTAAPVNVKNGAALLAQLLGPTPPPQGRFYTALNSSADPTTAVVTPNDSSKTLATNTFNFTVDRDPAHYVRAYLTYELFGQASFISAERIINGSQVNSALAGGVLILPTTSWSTQIERINPAWLVRGANSVQFKVLSSSFTNGGFTVRNVRIVGELDDGANAVETLSANQPDALGTNPVEALYDGDLATGWQPYPSDQPIEAVVPSVEFVLRRPTQMDAVSLYLSAPIAGQVQLSVKQAGVWSDFPAESGTAFDTGWNTISVPATVPPESRAYEGVRLTFSGGAGSSAEVREFLFVGSGVGGRTAPAKIFLAYPDAGQFYGRQGYVQGHIEPWNNGSGNATVTVGGTQTGFGAGQINTLKNKDNVGFAAQADSDAWSLEVKATYPNGETVATTVFFTQQLAAATPATGPLANSLSGTVSAKTKKTLSNDESTLVFPAGSVATDTIVTIAPLAEENVPALDVGMTNVTKGPRRGYRYLPHGAKFLQNVSVAMPYDRGLIPPGHTEDDVKTFYFDDQAGRWVELPRVSVDKTNKLINSTTDHFTDMINATVTVPDHPQTVSFNPTSMKDIKAADPGAQINLIEPPKVNNTGDARLSYPIEVPPGRQGIQPQFAVSYNSSGGNGWMGMGWDLAQRAITIDTRFGVPRYDIGLIDPSRGPLETETYMLEGEMLTPVAHRGDLVARTPDKIFHARVEGQFRKIIRHGSNPSEYWWEVIDKNGVRSIYGGNLATQTQDSTAVLKTDGGQVFRWALTEMRDLNGNRMTYAYDTVSDVGVAGGLVAGRQLYLRQCAYTDHPTSPAHYTVTFYRDSGVAPDRRPDVQIDARGGFKQVTANLLRRIEVKFDNRPVRSYQFEYQEGAFRKTLLKSVSQFGADGALFNTHSFGYFDDITAGQTFAGFFPSTDWNTQDDSLTSNFLGERVGPSALGGTEGIGGGASFSIGFAPFPTKYLSFNGMIGAGINRSKGKLSLVDIDGDGLPDKVFLDGGTIKFRRNTVTPRSDPLAPIAFESSAGIAQDMGVLSEDETLSFNFGGQAYVFGLNLIGDVGHSLTTQRSYISDVNGDGLPDIVKGGQVWFNRWRNKAARDFTPVFTASSAGSEFPIGAGAVNATGMLPEQDFQAIEQDLLQQNPLMDAVRRWTAPYSGHIAIDGDVRLIDVLTDPTATDEEKKRRADYKTADGVRVAIERPGLPEPLWRQDIAATDTTTLYTPTNTASLPVNKGDAVYFRVQSQFDGAYDEVNWAPRIRYLDTTEGGTVPVGATDVNRLDPYVFQAEREFVYAGRVNTMDAPFKGKVRVTGTLDKAVTTDDVRIAIYRFGETEFQQQFTHRRDYTLVHQRRAPVARYSMRWDEAGGLSFDGTPDIDVEPRDKLLVLVEVDSNVDLTKLQWRAANPLKLFYTQAFRTTDQPSDTTGGAPLKDADGNPIGWTPGEPIKVTDDAGNFIIQLTQQHEINFYPDNALNQAQGDFLAAQTGWLMVNPQVTPKLVTVLDGSGLPTQKPLFDHDSEIALTVKQRGELAGKRVAPLAAGKAYVPQQQSFAVPVYKGDRLFFDFSTRDPELYPTLDGTGVSVHYIRPQSVVTLNDIPLNQAGDGTAWPRAAGTLTVLPLLGAQPNAPALSGEVVLQVNRDSTDAQGNPVTEVVVERRIDFSTQTQFNPYAHAFDLPDTGSTFFFRYSTTNADLAAALTVHAVTIAVQTDFNATQQEFSGLTLFVQPPDVPSGDAGKALLSVGGSAATVAIAPVIKQGSALVSTVTGDATLTVVRRFVVTDPQNPNAPPQTQEVVVATHAISLTAGKRFNPGEHTFDVAAQANDTLVMYFTTQDPALAALALDWGLWTQTRRHVGGNAPTETPPSMLHRYGFWDLFANPYRGWAYVGYNSEGTFNGVALKDQPIVPARLTISSNDADYQVPDDRDRAKSKRVKDLTAFPAVPQQEQNRWFAGDEMWRVRADRIASSRMGLDFVRLPRGADYASSVPPDPGGAGATAVPRISIVKAETTTGIGFLVNINHTNTPGQGLLDFMDMNGDRFPDVVGGNTVQYTEMVGGLGGRRGSTDTPFVRDSISVADNIAPGGTVQKAVADAKGLFNGKIPGAEPANRNSNFGLTGSLGSRDSNVKAEYIDMNGDGLPDRVFDDGGTIRVALNLGYGFAQAEPWGSAVVDDSETKYVNAGVSYNDGVKAYAGSLAITRSLGKTRKKIIDINGDGLPDRVTESGGTLFVGINTGNGFADDKPWTGVSTTLSNNQSISLNGGVSFNYDIGPLCLFICFTNINPAVSLSTTIARSETTLQDVNGDGYPDRIASTEDGKMSVALNRTGRTNLLKTFSRPLGARVDIEYIRDGNTHEMPQSRWVLSKTTVFDGVVGNGPDTQVTTYKYEGGFYHRLEREFYGYQKVTEEHRDTAASETLYRFVTREYLSDSYYTKGLLKREMLQNAAGAPFTETENTYQLRDVTTGLVPANPLSTVGTIFPELIRTDKRFYEGNVSPGKSTFTTHEYDALGNIVRFTDDGEPGRATDNVDASITYTSCATYVIKPNHIMVRGNDVVMRERDATIDCLTGNTTRVQQFVGNGQVAITDLSYFSNGNLLTVKGPANKNLQNYTLTYDYDPDVTTHVALIRDSFGLSSQATHNPLFGKLETTTDTNGNQTTNVYDEFGRIDHIVGPYEQGLGQSQPTLEFKYHPEGCTLGQNGCTTPIPYAITRHVDKDAEGNYKASGTIDTVLFTDGLKRVIQTKKDAAVLETGATMSVDKMVVSGEVIFDAFGRTIAQKYPTTEAKGSDVENGVLNTIADTVAPTTMEYDVLDRNTKATIPDGTLTTIAYGFGLDRNGATQFETVVTDANVNAGVRGAVKRSYRDVRDLITSVKEFNDGLPLWTSYSYDALKQIVQIADDKLNTTTIVYDNLGQRTVVDNPDTGHTETQYDTASNITKKITANLKAQTKAIDYSYDFNRLSAITYPNFPGNNVTYAYGASGALGNTAGRITRVTSQMGVEERQYGKLGETVYEKKTVTTFTDPLHPSVFETRFFFETFGRLLRITYPDGEIVTNSYDSGGNLKSAEGVKRVDATGQNHRYVYLQSLLYDKFEQRVQVTQGNGVKTVYSYDANTRRLNNLNAVRQGNTIFQNLSYSYDKVGNVLGLKNSVDLPHANEYGGPSWQRFEYDDLYRLTKAQGVFPANVNAAAPDVSACAGVPTSQCRVYSVDLTYDTIHNIARKNQADTRYPPGAAAVVQKKTTYDFTYAYNPSGSASVRPHAPNHIGVRTYTYDADGNQTGWTHDTNGTRRDIVWDDENRIQSVADNGQTKTYKYDDQGQRLIKRGPQGETVYVNQFYTQRPGATGTKHIYAGTSRIASKLVRQDVPNSNPNGNTPFEKDLYFFHPDHLGSSNYVTDLNGKLYEHLEYFPFGEGWIEENTNQQRTPYLFSAKELDEETGLYYFGARYYDPRTSVWQSSDPILASYLPNRTSDAKALRGMGGVYRPMNMNAYHYSGLNPLKIVDPDGNEEILTVHDSEATNRQLSDIAMVYKDGTLGGTKLTMLKAWGAIKNFFGSSVNEKDVKFFFGDPEKSFDKFSSVSQDPEKYGTAAAGVMYDYKQKNMTWTSNSFIISSDLGEGVVPQDPKFNNGINPNNGGNLNKNYLVGVFMHPARGGTINDAYLNGSEGCSVRYGFKEMFNYLKQSPTGLEGRYMILR